MAAKVTIKQNPKKPVAVEVIADSIKVIADGVRRLRQGPLSDDALYLLIQRAAPSVGRGKYSYAKLSIRQIKAVLNGIESLEAAYLKPKPAKS